VENKGRKGRKERVSCALERKGSEARWRKEESSSSWRKQRYRCREEGVISLYAA
jgi:hypothetical protein